MSVNDDELATYSAVLAAIGAGDDELGACAAAGLDAAGFASLERRVEAALSLAMDAEGVGVDPFIARYEAAMRRAQSARAGGGSAPVALERLADGLAALGAADGDVVKALSRAGLTPEELMRAARAWAERLARDPELSARFVALQNERRKR